MICIAIHLTRFSCILLLLLIDIPVAAESILLAPNWKEKDKHVYELVKTKKEVNQDGVSSEVILRTQIAITVLAKDMSGVAILWEPGVWTFDDPALNEIPIFKLNCSNDVCLKVRLDAEGAFSNLINIEEVRDTNIQNAMNIAVFHNPNLDREKYKKSLRKILEKKDAVLPLVIKDAGIFFDAFGYQIIPGIKNIRVLSMPNPIGGGTIKLQAIAEVMELDNAANKLKTSLRLISDRKTLIDSSQKAMETVEKNIGRKLAAKDDKIPPFSITNETIYTYDLTGNHLVHAYRIISIKGEIREKTEIYELTYKDQ